MKNNRIYSNVQDNSLQIAGPIALDSGEYTCVASNGIDEARASATLRVQVWDLVPNNSTFNSQSKKLNQSREITLYSAQSKITHIFCFIFPLIS